MANKWDMTAQNAWNAILAKVRELNSSGMTYQEIADLMGVGNRSVISEWIAGNRKAEKTSFSNFMSYLERLGLDYADYFPEPCTKIKRIESNAPLETITGDTKSVPVYAVAGAGPGFVPEQQTPLFVVTAPPDYFRRCDYAVKVSGQSMEPLIPNGAIVGISTNSQFFANELYLAEIPYEGLVIKRIGVDHGNEEFIFKSENPNKNIFPDFKIKISEAEKIILGKVVWYMV